MSLSRGQAIAILGVVLALLYRYVWLRPWAAARADLPAVGAEPVQEPLDTPVSRTLSRGGQQYRVEQHHRYEVVGEVLSSETYALTFRSDFYDVDIGLIWGERVADLKDRYRFHQDGRWLFWRSSGPVSDEERAYITAHIGNHHVIPAEGRPQVARALRWADAGDVVRLTGFLVDIWDAQGQPVAQSSRSRDDSGNGACEIVWVDELQIGRRIYR